MEKDAQNDAYDPMSGLTEYQWLAVINPEYGVKYGMTEEHQKDAEGHHPTLTGLESNQIPDMSEVILDGDFAYFAGPDGYVWFALMENHEVLWDEAYPVAAHDHFYGLVMKETIWDGWLHAHQVSLLRHLNRTTDDNSE